MWLTKNHNGVEQHGSCDPMWPSSVYQYLDMGVLYLGMADESTEHPSVEAVAIEDDTEMVDFFNEDTKKSLNDGFLSHFLPEVSRLQESFHELT